MTEAQGPAFFVVVARVKVEEAEVDDEEEGADADAEEGL